MVRNDDHFVAVPNLGVLAEFAFEHANRAWSANIMRHEQVGVHPNIISSLDARFAGGAGKNFFSQCHKKIGVSAMSNRRLVASRSPAPPALRSQNS